MTKITIDRSVVEEALAALKAAHYKMIDAGMLNQAILNRNFTAHEALRDSLRQAMEQTQQEPDMRCKVKLGSQYGEDLAGHWFYLRPADEFAEQALTKRSGVTAIEQALTPGEPVDNDRVMTVVYRDPTKDDVQSFLDHPKAVWFGWCHAPYQRDDALWRLEKATTPQPQRERTRELECVIADLTAESKALNLDILHKLVAIEGPQPGTAAWADEVMAALEGTAPQPQREWVGLTDDEANELWESTDSDWELMKRTEAKLRSKNT